MSYIVQEPSNFINIKLTDTGRRLLSLGQLTFNKIILSDREVNYAVGRAGYNICRNRILQPKDDQPKTSYYSVATNNYTSSVYYGISSNGTIGRPSVYFNAGSFNGSPPVPISSQNLISAKQIVSALTESRGFFSGNSNGFEIKTSAPSGDGQCLGTSQINYSAYTPNGGTQITIQSGGYSANTGDLIFIPWETPQYSAITNNSNTIYSGRPNVSLWYRVQSRTGLQLELDRSVPNFGNSPILNTSQSIQMYYYPFGDVESFYGSAVTVNCGVWNMNIVRTCSIIGTTALMSGYTSYGSIEFNGTKQYLGFDNRWEQIGVIHYTNKYSGNTYAEQFVPGTVKLEIPNVMWHRHVTTTLGKELDYGITLKDEYGSTNFDAISNTYYRDLRDGSDITSKVVGRVYHKLKIIVITDNELLTALTYKSNRNYTLPEPILTLIPPTIGVASGFCKSDFTYFVTYTTSSEQYSNGISYGYPQSLPCSYVSAISGYTAPGTSANYLLRVNFPSFSFPYLRSDSDLNTLSGTGWNANSVQILVKQMPTSSTTMVGNVSTEGWRLISNGVGNGIFTGSTGNGTISASDLQSHVFVMTQEDYDSGTTYSLSGKYSAFTSNIDSINASGLTFGDESFFYGNLTTGIQANVFKTVITVMAPNSSYNSSVFNTTFNGLYDDSAYITEIGITNANDELVAVAKPSYPIKKNESRFLSFQLELDF